MSSALGRLGFLIVDDNPNMVSIIKAILKTFGVEHIYDAGTIDSAFAIVRQYGIDIVFVDYMLGAGVDGVEFVKLLRSSPESPNPYVPIIMLTAYSELQLVQRARDAGVTEFCVKPVTPIAIYRKIVQVIERPRPFVRTETYFGPDRRRRQSQDYTGPERRKDAAAKSRAAESAGDGA